MQNPGGGSLDLDSVAPPDGPLCREAVSVDRATRRSWREVAWFAGTRHQRRCSETTLAHVRMADSRPAGFGGRFVQQAYNTTGTNEHPPVQTSGGRYSGGTVPDQD
jgi:hypothetical protein